MVTFGHLSCHVTKSLIDNSQRHGIRSYGQHGQTSCYDDNGSELEFESQVDVHDDEQTFGGYDQLDEDHEHSKAACEVPVNEGLVSLHPVVVVNGLEKLGLDDEADQAEGKVDEIDDGVPEEIAVNAVLELLSARKDDAVDGVGDEAYRAEAR